MLAEFEAPAGFAVWIGCAAFLLIIINEGFKLGRNVRGKDPEPPNAQLGVRVTVIETRTAKTEAEVARVDGDLSAFKDTVIKNGEERKNFIINHVDVKAGALQQQINKLPGEIIATLRNTGAIGGHSGHSHD